MNTVLIVIALAVLGLIMGSFVNALVWRVHKQQELEDKKDKQSKELFPKLSIVNGHSMCSHCHHPLAPKDLIPVVSWVWLRGKCRYCHRKIEDTPVAELLTALLFVISYIFWPSGLRGFGLAEFGIWLAFIVGFVALAIYDICWYLLPDRIVFPLVVLAVVEVLVHILFFGGSWPLFIATVWGVLIASGFFFVLYQVSNGKWIGGGDVKLGLVLGILLGGPLNSIFLLFLSSLLGTIVSIPLLVRRKAKRGILIPYGPFLLMAAFIIMLFGARMQDWLSTFLMG
jgi:leader peptidase (prepilin peptidase) / N-methyltransferase